MSNSAKQQERLDFWRERLRRSESAYAPELEAMERRERQYLGDRSLAAAVEGDNTVI